MSQDLTPIVIVGPTGAGKSEVSLAVAERLSTGAEIINADSMQMYKGLDIGTAKLPAADRRGIKHHQFDVLNIAETASVAKFISDATRLVPDIQQRGMRPIIVGGSMMYVQSLVDDWNLPPTDPEVRARWQALQDEIGVEAMHDRLAEVDPAAAAIIERKDPRRIVRALEVIELTGKPFAASQPPKNMPTRWGAKLFGLQAPAEWLNPRLELRVEKMFDAGLVDEVKALQERGLVKDSTAGQAIGYQQALSALAGEMSMAEAKEATVTGTRRYARRQRSWFRRDPRIHWLDATCEDPDLLAEEIIGALS